MTDRNLIDLLPAVYRARDRAQGGVLEALLDIIGEEARRIEADVEALYDDWFIETCREWVVPDIGDLLGVRALLPIDDPAFTQRAYVANTLGYRRRKGTAGVLEQLARDLTGWPARAVEYFERLVTTQHVNHVRPYATATADLRDAHALTYASTPLETVTHTAEVRHIDNARGRYGIANVGLHLWRLQAYPLTDVSARQIDATRFTVDPLGGATTLFNDFPMPLSRRILHRDLAQYYGDADDPASVVVSVGGDGHAAEPDRGVRPLRRVRRMGAQSVERSCRRRPAAGAARLRRRTQRCGGHQPCVRLRWRSRRRTV